MKGFFALLGTAILTVICPPLGISAGLVALTGWAVFGDDKDVKKRRLPARNADSSSLREDIGSLTADLPHEAQNRLVQEIISRIKEMGYQYLGDDEGHIAVKRNGNTIIAWISKDGHEGHTVEFQLP